MNVEKFKNCLEVAFNEGREKNLGFYKLVERFHGALRSYIQENYRERYKFIIKNENDELIHEIVRNIVDRNVYYNDNGDVTIDDTNKGILFADLINFATNIVDVKKIAVEYDEKDRQALLVLDASYKELEERLTKEHIELAQKILRLENFKASTVWLSITDDERYMLDEQRQYMGHYAEALRRRIEYYRTHRL
nr:MAG TPA: hypothetical protein [Caudoviricetes sp.]